MKGLNHPYFVYNPVLNNFTTDDETSEKLIELGIHQYASIERFNDLLLIKFEIQGDKLISLSDLIRLKTNTYQYFDLEYAIIAINSILVEFQNKYEKNKYIVNFDPNEIWIGSELKPQSQVQVIFTKFDLEQQQNCNPDISQLKQTIQQFLELFSQTDLNKIQDMNNSLQKCDKIKDIQNIIKKKLPNCQQLKINHDILQVDQNLGIVLNKPNEIKSSLNEQNYCVLKNNLINWVVKGNYKFNQDITIRDIFIKLNLEASYKILTLWQDVDKIFIILKENGILNNLQNFQNINSIIFKLTFPKYQQKLGNLYQKQLSENTLKWIEQVEKHISKNIELYIDNILGFYKGDKEIWMIIDFKCIFNEVRLSFDSILCFNQNVQIIENYDIVIENTSQIIKQYYEGKVKKLNQEIVKIIFNKN